MAKGSTWDDVAAALNKDPRQIHRWRKLPGAPTLPDVAAWREWKSQREQSSPTAGGESDVAPAAKLPGECDYDDLVKAGQLTYATAKVREQVISEKIANETKRIEQAKAKGELVTREDATNAAVLVRDKAYQAWDRAIQRALSDLATEAPATMPAELRAKILAGVNAALDAD